MNSNGVKKNMASLINDQIRQAQQAGQSQQARQVQKSQQVQQAQAPRKLVLSWKDTTNFRGNPYSMVANLLHICGENVYGKHRGCEFKARKSVTSFLERSAKMDVFKCVEGGDVIKAPPTRDDMINKLVGLGNRAIEYYSNLPYQQTDVTDHWAKDARVRLGAPMNKSIQTQSRVLNRSGKRFSAKDMTVKETVIDMIKTCGGMLAEGHVVAFLNSGLQCPECSAVGNIGWCDGITHRSVDAFRDAVCMNCLKNNNITLFEIKTRWENAVLSGGNGTYAGSFVALNTLMSINANVYLVLVSRDTGDVRIGKITSAKMRGNHNWLYALQEGFTWGGPSSYVTCAKGLMRCPVKMTPIIETLPRDVVDSIAKEAISKITML